MLIVSVRRNTTRRSRRHRQSSLSALSNPNRQSSTGRPASSDGGNRERRSVTNRQCSSADQSDTSSLQSLLDLSWPLEPSNLTIDNFSGDLYTYFENFHEMSGTYYYEPGKKE